MVRLIDPAIEKLSKTINEMGQDAITCFSLAVDSYLEDRETAPQVHDLSEKIRKNYYSVEDQIFDIMLKYQPIAVWCRTNDRECKDRRLKVRAANPSCIGEFLQHVPWTDNGPS